MDRNIIKLIKCALIIIAFIIFSIYYIVSKKNSKKNATDSSTKDSIDAVDENFNSSINDSVDVIEEKSDVLEKIEVTDERYIFLNDIDNLKFYSGLDNSEIEKLKEKSIEKLNIDIPEEYKEFLKISNGVTSDNGAKFYSKFDLKKRGRYDIVDINYDYRELTDIEDFIKLGNDDISYFVYDINTSKYQVLSDGTLDVLNEYNHFYELLKAVLTGEIY